MDSLRLPKTNFQKSYQSRFDALNMHDKSSKEREREVIQNQPYRTTPIITPTPKVRTDFVNLKTDYYKKRPVVRGAFNPQSIPGVTPKPPFAYDGGNAEVVHRQFNSPLNLYSHDNASEALFQQTGVRSPASPNASVMKKLEPNKIAKKPDHVHYDPNKSPTFRALIEEEGLGVLHEAPKVQTATPVHHNTAPSYQYGNLNSVGQPYDRIPQSDSFMRLMAHLRHN